MADNSSRKFKFISPGVFIDEIDNSQLPEQPGAVGPLVIGRSRKGPANKPVTVSSFSDFVQTFGEPVPGNENSDVWREGNHTAPTYAAYAAQAWLRNSSPLTFMRVLGDESSDASASGKAGWKVNPVKITGTAKEMNANGGVYALCVWPSSSATASPHLSGAVAAQIYMDSGRVLVSGTVAGTETTSQAGSTVYEVSSLDDITLVFTGSAVNSKVTVSLNPDSENFIRKALNTNPTITNSAITDAATQTFYQGGIYFLGESFERSLVATGSTSIGELAGGSTAGYYVAMLPMIASVSASLGTVQQNDFEGAATRASTGWFISQDLSNNNAAYFARNMQKLFRLEALSAGEWTQRDVKISISNIKAPQGDYQSFGTFSVLVRDLQDTDSRPVILERFDELSLNPAAANYIAKAIGDKYEVYDQGEKRLVQYGEYDNRSNFIRVVMNDDVAAGTGESRWLPFGVWGPLKYRDVGYASGSGGWSSDLGGPVSASLGATQTLLFGGSDDHYGNIGHSQGTQRDLLHVPLFEATTVMTLNSTVTKAGLDGDTFVLTDTNGDDVTFDFEQTVNTVTDGTIGILGMADLNTDVLATQIAAAINDASITLNITAVVTDPGGAGKSATISLTQQQGGSAGNRVVDMSGVTDIDAPDFTGGGGFKGSISFPSVPLRTLSTWGEPKSLKSTYWGAWTGRTGTDTFFNSQIPDCLRIRSFDVSSNSDPASTSHDVEGEQTALEASDPTTISWVFSLDNVSGSSAAGYTYGSGYRAAGTSLTAPGDASYKTALAAGIDRFTTTLHGGSDGYNIKEREPFRNTKMTATDEKDSYELFSLRKAVNIAADKDFVQMNAVTIPGIWRPAVTNFLLDAAEERGDALAIIDLQYGFTPSTEDTGSVATRNAANTATQAADTLAARSINNSYGAAYYPWVRILDTNTNQNLWVPPSVAALGVLSSTDRINAPWFAPAGFTRGGLSEGAAGLPVLDVSRRLTSDERDKLYENNINPIAKFPAEGIVIFGQKTLQQTASALDRINVRRLMIYLKREISFIASRLLFGPNTKDTWDRFLGQAGPLLESVRAEFGIDDFRLVLDETTTTPDLVDRNIIYAKLLVKPTRSVEYFAIDFVVTNSGAAFED
tara:strand:+ start:424 stop:3795 length:3372 start_codon:yes stop_codon:yes gene_type:complete